MAATTIGRPIRRVLVPVKPHERGLPPGAYRGRMLAEQFGAELILTSCVYDSTVAMRLGRNHEGAAAAQRSMLDAERLALERLAKSIRDWGVAVSTDVRWHQPAYEGMLQAAEQSRADLVAVDALESHPSLHTRLTDTDWQLMRRCPCPLLFINDPDADSYETILAAVDPLHVGPRTEQTDARVLAEASLFARAFGADLRVVHAFPDPAGYTWVSSVQVRPGVFFGIENLEEAHRNAVELLVREHGIDEARIDMRVGAPADVILDIAGERNAKLIVLGALERGEIEQVMLGSTTEAVVAEAPCDVLLVKAK